MSGRRFGNAPLQGDLRIGRRLAVAVLTDQAGTVTLMTADEATTQRAQPREIVRTHVGRRFGDGRPEPFGGRALRALAGV